MFEKLFGNKASDGVFHTIGPYAGERQQFLEHCREQGFVKTCLLRQRLEFPARRVEAEDLALLDHVVPAVQADLTALDALTNDRESHEPLELDHDGPHLGPPEVCFGHLGVDGGGPRELEPSGDMRRIGPERREQGSDRAAVAVAADDDVLHREHECRELDSGRRAVEAGIGSERRDEVADVADDEEVSRKGARQEVGDDAGVRAADEQGAWALSFSDEALVVLTEAREGLASETSKAFHELLRHRLFFLRCLTCFAGDAEPDRTLENW
jgi:hypothetical protein